LIALAPALLYAVDMSICITNLKSGVGKTTISINLALCFAHMGYRVCILDTDTNQSSLKWYGARDESLPDVLAIGTTVVHSGHVDPPVSWAINEKT